jgi:hypothetical protein
LGHEVQDSGLAGGEDELDAVEFAFGDSALLFLHVFEIDSNQAMHDTVFLIILSSVAEEVAANEDSIVRLVFVGLSLQEHFAFQDL